MHEQSHLKWLFQIKQVKPEQGWGSLEFCTRCWLLIYSLVKQGCASSEEPETSGQHQSTVPCTSTKCFSSGWRGMSRQSKGLPKDHPTDAAGSLTSSWAQQTPSTWVTFYKEPPTDFLRHNQGDPTLFSSTGNTPNKHHAAVDKVGSGSPFFSLGGLAFPWLSESTDVFLQGAQPSCCTNDSL